MGSENMRTGTWLAYDQFAPAQLSGTGRPSGTSTNSSVSTLSDFSSYFAAQLPELANSISATDLGVPLREVEALKLATREAIVSGNWPAVHRHFEFVDHVLESADFDLHDALGITYLCSLFYGETSRNYAEARCMLPKRMKDALEIMERHYEEGVHNRAVRAG